jgi:16S rRNA processing protein RimM
VAVVPLTDFVDRFEELESAIIDGRTRARVKILGVRFHRQQLLITFAGIDTRNQAEDHIGDFICVEKSELIELPEHTFFQFEVIGMKVFTEQGEFLGEIKEIIEMPANDLWRISGEREFIIPASENVVLSVDKTERKIVIRLIEGLLDIQS